MKLRALAFAATLMLSLPLAAMAAVVTVSGNGQSHDYAAALNAAEGDAIAKCSAQGGTPLDIVYTHVTSHAVYYATVVKRCEVP